MLEKKSTRQGYGDGLVLLGKEHDNVVALDGDLACATGSGIFKDVYPDRFFNAGIAEQNMIGLAAGLSRTGLVPFASSFAVFSAGRAFELIRNGVCYSKANVKIVGAHAGITAFGDGGTHQSIEDLALMRVLPNMTVLNPCDYNQAIQMVRMAYEINGPVYLRITREPTPVFTKADEKLVPGKAQVLREGDDLCIIATGLPVYMAVEAADELAQEGIRASVLNIHTLKPLDTETIRAYAQRCGKVLVVEEHNVIGGLNEAVSAALVGQALKYDRIGVEDRFGQSGLIDEVLEEYGMTTKNILTHARAL